MPTVRPTPTMVDRAQRPMVSRGQPQVRPLAGALLVALDQLEADPNQPRKDWAHREGERRLGELAESIREFGVLQPLLVSEVEGSGPLPRYRVIAGGRRLEAARLAGLASVPVVVREADLIQVRIMQLTENLQRQELAPLDEARSFQELMDIKGVSAPALAAQLHVSPQHVRDRLRLLADQVLADAVERRQIGASVAREILKLPDEELEALRRRVERGERLQVNDIAQARARLHAEGIVNPRRNLRKESRPVEAAPQERVEAAASPAHQAAAMPPPAAPPTQDGHPIAAPAQFVTPPSPGDAVQAAPTAAPRNVSAASQDVSVASQDVSAASRDVSVSPWEVSAAPETIALSALALAAVLRPALEDLPEALRDRVLQVRLPRGALRAALTADCRRLDGE